MARMERGARGVWGARGVEGVWRERFAHRSALSVAQVRVYDLDEVEGVLVEVGQRLDVEGDDRPHLVERPHLTDDPHDGTLPASVAAARR